MDIALGPEAVARCIERTNIGFMFAQTYHPAMRFAAPLRREIGIRTVFNILGPLTNPAGARAQVLGAPSKATQTRLAGALRLLGIERALVVHGLDGVDEISIASPTSVLDVQGGASTAYDVHPEEMGLRTASLESVKGGDATENAAIIRSILAGRGGADAEGPRRDMVALNAGAALLVSGAAGTLRDGVGLAAEVLDSGAGLVTLDAFASASRELA